MSEQHKEVSLIGYIIEQFQSLDAAARIRVANYAERLADDMAKAETKAKLAVDRETERLTRNATKP